MRLLAPALAVLALLAGCGDGEDGGRSTAGEPRCADVEAPAAREADEQEAPRRTLAPTRDWSLVFETSCGRFTVALDLTLAPETSASLVSLARSGFYDDTMFHRVVPDFVVQGGDPTQSGTGGPGYVTLDRPPSSVRYTKGVVAMAKTAIAPAGSAGSQFFVVTAEDAGLEPVYAVVGRVIDGMGVVEAIDALGNTETQRPERPVVVRRVSVVEE